MKKNIILLIAALAFGLWACTPETLETPETPGAPDSGSFVSKVSGKTYSYNQLQPRVLKVKFNDSYVSRIEAVGASVETLCADTKSSSVPFSKYKPVSMRRLFPDGGAFEQRRRAYGLHKWYVLEFDQDIDFADAEFLFAAAEEVETVEFSQVLKRTAVDYPFNDPRLSSQWHYYNPGTASGTSEGSDINVFPVWQDYAPGADDVIVAVVDGGIDLTHPDLADNLWSDPDNPNVHGHNFIYGNNSITATTHGTHVAGTIGAVNNNGIGVCGVAGGDAERGIPGVRLMSCQIFPEEDDGPQGEASEAIAWAADHGAVIAQNSWGYNLDTDGRPGISAEELRRAENLGIDDSLRDAVDYFIDNAGCDADGNQTGPMKGGVVIFAAGNDNIHVGPPASAYAPIICVSAIGADFRRASYSNYGDWCDIAAPGGDAYTGWMIWSTTPGSGYGELQGTSMACPHVSGVAALIVANMGGPGFTNEDLETLLIGTARTEVIETYNMGYHLGGLVDAGAAVSQGRDVHHTLSPESASASNVKLSQTAEIAFKVSNPTGHDLQIEVEPEIPGVSAVLSDDKREVIVRINGAEVAQGEYNVSHEVSGTVYVSCDQEPGERYSASFTATVDPNTNPINLRKLDGLVVDVIDERVRISLGTYFFDSDGDPLTYAVSETSLGKFDVSGSQVTFTAETFGTDEVSVTASDGFGGSVTVTAPILVRDGKARTFDVYPNPVADYLYVRGSEEADVVVEIYSGTGAKVFSDELETSPFEPAEIDMSAFDGGIYFVKLDSDGVKQEVRISKL